MAKKKKKRAREEERETADRTQETYPTVEHAGKTAAARQYELDNTDQGSIYLP